MDQYDFPGATLLPKGLMRAGQANLCGGLASLQAIACLRVYTSMLLLVLQKIEGLLKAGIDFLDCHGFGWSS